MNKMLIGLMLLASPAPAAGKKAPQKAPEKAAAVKVDASTPAASVPVQAPSSAPITTALIVERFEELDAKLVTLSSEFHQSIRWDESGTMQSLEGRLDYRKKDHLHLEHRLPEPQTIVADGESLWIWRRSTNQVIRTRLEEWKKSEPMAQGLMDFGNYGDMLKRYEVRIGTVSPAGADGHRGFTIMLTPKEKRQDFILTMSLSTKDFFPYDTELRVGEVTIHSLFDKVSFNPELPDSLFRFTPPPGADVFIKSSKATHGP